MIGIYIYLLFQGTMKSPKTSLIIAIICTIVFILLYLIQRWKLKFQIIKTPFVDWELSNFVTKVLEKLKWRFERSDDGFIYAKAGNPIVGLDLDFLIVLCGNEIYINIISSGGYITTFGKRSNAYTQFYKMIQSEYNKVK